MKYLALAVLLLAGCAPHATTTDRLILYPTANAKQTAKAVPYTTVVQRLQAMCQAIPSIGHGPYRLQSVSQKSNTGDNGFIWCYDDGPDGGGKDSVSIDIPADVLHQ